MIYTDGIHIVAGSLVELHVFAAKVGIKRCWFSPSAKHPHYDKPKKVSLRKVIDAGALMTSSREVAMVALSCVRSVRSRKPSR